MEGEPSRYWFFNQMFSCVGASKIASKSTFCYIFRMLD